MTDKTPKRSLRLLLGAATLVVFASCQTTDPRYNHWNFSGLTPRIAYHLLSYDTEGGKPYYQHANDQRSSINLTIQRHLFGDNPENPNRRENVWIPNQRPFSPCPNPFNFFHLSSVAFGSALLGAGGGFVLFPIEVIPVMLEEGGPTELWAGFRQTFTGKSNIQRGPAPPSEFRVKNH